MRAVVQRVLEASVSVNNQVAGQIGPGLLVYLGVEKGDSNDDLIWLAEKIVKMRIFPDSEEKMNFPVTEIAGSILVISQFTLFADMTKGNRPSFNNSAEPALAREMYEDFIEYLKKKEIQVQCGIFAAHMFVESLNDGPVTIPLDSRIRI
jgi:D-tyrosyl-tRNA(Tyr) deacylase